MAAAIFVVAQMAQKDMAERERRKREYNAPFPDPASLGNICQDQSLAFKWCLRRNVRDISKCQVYMDQVHRCCQLSLESAKKA